MCIKIFIDNFISLWWYYCDIFSICEMKTSLKFFLIVPKSMPQNSYTFTSRICAYSLFLYLCIVRLNQTFDKNLQIWSVSHLLKLCCSLRLNQMLSLFWHQNAKTSISNSSSSCCDCDGGSESGSSDNDCESNWNKIVWASEPVEQRQSTRRPDKNLTI